MQNNPLQTIMNIANAGKNPEAIFDAMLTQNPQAQQMNTQIKNMMGKQTPKEFCMQLAKQKGINPAEIEQIAQRLAMRR